MGEKSQELGQCSHEYNLEAYNPQLTELKSAREGVLAAQIYDVTNLSKTISCEFPGLAPCTAGNGVLCLLQTLFLNSGGTQWHQISLLPAAAVSGHTCFPDTAVSH